MSLPCAVVLANCLATACMSSHVFALLLSGLVHRLYIYNFFAHPDILVTGSPKFIFFPPYA
ncbi:hypothetical protein M422DRAFT_222604, partial [Sphaerobolus stellatus SS14]